MDKVLFDREKQQIAVNGKNYNLTLTEAQLFDLLYNNVGKMVPREEAIKTIWGGRGKQKDNYRPNRSMDVYIRKLRIILEDSPYYIKNHFGKGHSLEIKNSDQ